MISTESLVILVEQLDKYNIKHVEIFVSREELVVYTKDISFSLRQDGSISITKTEKL